MILWMESFSKGDDGPWDIRIYWIIQFVTTLTSFALFWWVKEINKMWERDTSPTQTEDQPTSETALTLSP
jgi:large-conductance mechanosensitive channel